jgi:NAD kinase
VTKAGSSTVSPRAVVVTRPTEYEALLARHATREQARFFLEQRGRSLPEVEERHARREAALQTVSSALPMRWRRTRVDRADLDRFVFGPEDVVVVVGQDGLVANAAKYLAGQPVLGVNPDRDLFDGVLVRHDPSAAVKLLGAVVEDRVTLEARTMVEAKLDDGQRLVALNEIFVGHRSHQSARYRLRWHDAEETQSSSGLIVSTGTGATGWARSIARQKPLAFELPRPTEQRLAFFVREPFPSRSTGTTIEQGTLGAGESVVISSEMNELGTVFGDGIETDRLELGWGMRLTIGIAPNRLNLIVA